MNPYTRFTTVSNLMAASITVGAVLAFGMPTYEAISSLTGGEPGTTLMAASGAGLALIVLGWLAMTEVIFPLVFRISAVRKMVLGKYFIEGTWLQAERGSNEKRMSVIDIQPDGKRFIFSGYSIDEDLEIQSNIMIEFSRFEWPFMVYKYRNSLSDGSDGRRDGVGEIQLEMNRASARRYNGFLQYVRSDERLKIEGAKLTSGAEIRNLRKLDGRQLVLEKYWKLFFHRAMKPAHMSVGSAPSQNQHPADAVMAQIDQEIARKNVETDQPAPFVERRSGKAAPSQDTVVPRRRATDWGQPGEARPAAQSQTHAKSKKRTGTKN